MPPLDTSTHARRQSTRLNSFGSCTGYASRSESSSGCVFWQWHITVCTAQHRRIWLTACGWHQRLLLVAVCTLSTLLRCWCRQPVDQLSVTARFLWLQRGRGTVCLHRPGPPPRYWHFGGRPSLILSVRHLADRSLALSLLIDSETVSTRSATLCVLLC